MGMYEVREFKLGSNPPKEIISFYERLFHLFAEKDELYLETNSHATLSSILQLQQLLPSLKIKVLYKGELQEDPIMFLQPLWQFAKSYKGKNLSIGLLQKHDDGSQQEIGIFSRDLVQAQAHQVAQKQPELGLYLGYDENFSTCTDLDSQQKNQKIQSFYDEALHLLDIKATINISTQKNANPRFSVDLNEYSSIDSRLRLEASQTRILIQFPERSADILQEVIHQFEQLVSRFSGKFNHYSVFVEAAGILPNLHVSQVRNIWVDSDPISGTFLKILQEKEESLRDTELSLSFHCDIEKQQVSFSLSLDPKKVTIEIEAKGGFIDETLAEIEKKAKIGIKKKGFIY